jgi:serine/threonine protein phosphatase 1
MSNRRFVIGDVHGHYDALSALLTNIELTSDDEVYFLGDLIDRGPQSSQVVEFVKQSGYKCLLGNHEIMLLDVLGNGGFNAEAFHGWLYNGGFSTVVSYKNKIPPEHIDWLKNLPLYLDLEDYLLVHAGVDPYVPLEQQNSEQLCWIRDPFHSITSPVFPEKTIIVGHTITFTFAGVKPGNIAAGEGWLSIDTGVYHHTHGWLTALELDQSIVHQVNSFGNNYRSLPLEQVITKIDPEKILTRRERVMF